MKKSYTLSTDHPEKIIDRYNPQLFLEAVGKNETWTEREFCAIDDVLTNWTTDYIAREKDLEGLIELQSTILRILSSLDSKNLGELKDKYQKYYEPRWRVLSDLIGGRHIILENRDPDRVKKSEHVQKIESILQEDGEIEQKELLKRMNLPERRLFEILSLMEANGIIERYTSGRDLIISKK
ncbi:Uncharacterised protein [uncultured archaeon]|nr:Uncharacterised protein [uncultured archaeon]